MVNLGCLRPVSVTFQRVFSFTVIAQESVEKSLSKLSVWKAVGQDGIPNRVLKECVATLAEPPTFIFNSSLTSGLFPMQWKQGVIEPLFKKKGARTEPSCYRPVVLLPCVSKVLEGFVCEQLQWHRIKTCVTVIRDGFLPKRSTFWQILSVVEHWEQAIEAGSTIHACFSIWSRCHQGIWPSGPHSTRAHAVNCWRACQGALLVC